MNYYLRIFFSGIFGLVIVVGLFLMMLKLISNDWSTSEPTTTTVKIITYQAPVDQTKKLKPIEVQKKQREKPLLQQAPDLTLTETGNLESGQGVNAAANSDGTEYGTTLSGSDGVSNGAGGLDTNYMAKYYEHSLKFPEQAKQGGITQGYLVTKAVFSKSHEFLRFEITEESPVGYFRDVLYQLKFVRHWGGHLYHPKYSVQKTIPKDAKNIHHETYKFIFNLNSTEPIKMYIYNSYSN